MSDKARWKPLKYGSATKRYAAFLAAEALDHDEKDEDSTSSWQALRVFALTGRERERERERET